MCENKSFSLSF